MKKRDITRHLRPVVVPHDDGNGTVIQICASQLPGIATVFVYCPRISLPVAEDELHRLIPTAFVDVLFDARDAADWMVIDCEMKSPAPPAWRNQQPTIRGSTEIVFVSMGALRNLINACAGFYPWRAFADANELDYLLIPGAARPAAAKL
ncbi:hypothetical protein LBMAG48_23820 [Phycisphaerae bacterium]|nr:hypothetical protein LBMAG48_23820 [Phycisphaerae bacterium]